MNEPQKRRPERQRPGLKLQTPHEQRTMAKATAADRARWEHLFHPARNRWKPTK